MNKSPENKMIQADELKQYMNSSEVANYLGWHRAHVSVYRRKAENGEFARTSFPTPDIYVGKQAFWKKDTIKTWADRNIEKLKSDGEYFME